MKTTSLYDFTLTANGTFVILADANFYKVLTATGDIQVTRDGGATIKPLRAGRGERNVPFQRLILKDISGAPNSGTILVGDSDFIDDTIVISSAINVRPEAASGSYASTGALAANTAEAIFTPGVNTGGAILLQADMTDANTVMMHQAMIAKTSAPASVTDGEVIVQSRIQNTALSNPTSIAGSLMVPQYIAAGKGLYFISSAATNSPFRSARYKLL